MRLIDADSIELRVRSGIEKDGLLFIPYVDVKKSIANTPTAYDVDKVVEELDEATWQYNPPFNDEPYRMVILSNKAVQIVKRGGVE